MSANGNDGIEPSTPTLRSRASRPSEESVAIATAVIGSSQLQSDFWVLKEMYNRKDQGWEGDLRL